MEKILFVGLGGFVGSVLRYWAASYVQHVTRSVEFPYGTLAVNVIGCLLIGALSYLVEAHGILTPEARALVFVGLLGGFTTYSGFGNETVSLFLDGQKALALTNIGAQLVLGLGAVWLGRVMAYLIWR